MLKKRWFTPLECRDYCWKRAHAATSPKWRTFWFDAFECYDQYRLTFE